MTQSTIENGFRERITTHRSKVFEENSGHATAFKHSVHRFLLPKVLYPTTIYEKTPPDKIIRWGKNVHIPEFATGEFMKALNLMAKHKLDGEMLTLFS